jgi:hypothetical protein
MRPVAQKGADFSASPRLEYLSGRNFEPAQLGQALQRTNRLYFSAGLWGSIARGVGFTRGA